MKATEITESSCKEIRWAVKKPKWNEEIDVFDKFKIILQ